MGNPIDIDMAREGRAATIFSSRCSRRGLLGWSLVAGLALVACGDESGTRQFAGGPQTAGPSETSGMSVSESNPASPTALTTRMPVAELLAPRGETGIALIVDQNRLVSVELESGESRELWADPNRSIWAVAATPSGERVATLTAPGESSTGWAIDFIDADGELLGHVEFGPRASTPADVPDAVAGGQGGLAWIGESASVAVAVPSGGLQQVYSDGSQVPILSASMAKRPAAVAITDDAGTIAYVNQPSGSEGSGIYAGSIKAKPIDPIVVLPADRSGNRYARDLAWIAPGGRVATIIERGELGNPQGDLFFIDTETGTPALAWTSPAGREVWSVESFAISQDGSVVAFLTNSSNPQSTKSSSAWLMQVDGSALERFDLPLELTTSRLVFSSHGVAISGIVRTGIDEDGGGAVYLVTPDGDVVERYREPTLATPVASPIASPEATPVASPEASPSPQASPVES